jgi:hypothetical protein
MLGGCGRNETQDTSQKLQAEEGKFSGLFYRDGFKTTWASGEKRNYPSQEDWDFRGDGTVIWTTFARETSNFTYSKKGNKVVVFADPSSKQESYRFEFEPNGDLVFKERFVPIIDVWEPENKRLIKR